MAVALAGAPVIYPWYLLYLTPFLFSRVTLPLLGWTLSILPVYLVWYVPALRGPWQAPAGVMIAEFGAVLAAVVWLGRGFTSRMASRSTE